VLDVLFLLSVSGRLFQSSDDEGRGGGNDGDSGLSILDGELDGDTETFLVRISNPVAAWIFCVYEPSRP
jgi:hypothetical protein